MGGIVLMQCSTYSFPLMPWMTALMKVGVAIPLVFVCDMHHY